MISASIFRWVRLYYNHWKNDKSHNIVFKAQCRCTYVIGLRDFEVTIFGDHIEYFFYLKCIIASTIFLQFVYVLLYVYTFFLFSIII